MEQIRNKQKQLKKLYLTSKDHRGNTAKYIEIEQILLYLLIYWISNLISDLTILILVFYSEIIHGNK